MLRWSFVLRVPGQNIGVFNDLIRHDHFVIKRLKVRYFNFVRLGRGYRRCSYFFTDINPLDVVNDITNVFAEEQRDYESQCVDNNSDSDAVPCPAPNGLGNFNCALSTWLADVLAANQLRLGKLRQPDSRCTFNTLHLLDPPAEKLKTCGGQAQMARTPFVRELAAASVAFV